MAHYERLLTAAHFVRGASLLFINLQELTRLSPWKRQPHRFAQGARIRAESVGYQKSAKHLAFRPTPFHIINQRFHGLAGC